MQCSVRAVQQGRRCGAIDLIEAALQNRAQAITHDRRHAQIIYQHVR